MPKATAVSYLDAGVPTDLPWDPDLCDIDALISDMTDAAPAASPELQLAVSVSAPLAMEDAGAADSANSTGRLAVGLSTSALVHAAVIVALIGPFTSERVLPQLQTEIPVQLVYGPPTENAALASDGTAMDVPTPPRADSSPATAPASAAEPLRTVTSVKGADAWEEALAVSPGTIEPRPALPELPDPTAILDAEVTPHAAAEAPAIDTTTVAVQSGPVTEPKADTDAVQPDRSTDATVEATREAEVTPHAAAEALAIDTTTVAVQSGPVTEPKADTDAVQPDRSTDATVETTRDVVQPLNEWRNPAETAADISAEVKPAPDSGTVHAIPPDALTRVGETSARAEPDASATQQPVDDEAAWRTSKAAVVTTLVASVDSVRPVAPVATEAKPAAVASRMLPTDIPTVQPLIAPEARPFPADQAVSPDPVEAKPSGQQYDVAAVDTSAREAQVEEGASHAMPSVDKKAAVELVLKGALLPLAPNKPFSR